MNTQRVIKFRAWDGYTMVQFRIGGSMPSDKDLSWISDQKIMQSTGLKDSKGVEIFEGDVVRNVTGGRDIRKVTWEENNTEPFCFCYYENSNDFEVIGNIYQHPELLK